MNDLPDTPDYYMDVIGINEEAMYHVINRHTEVHEVICKRFYMAFDEMYSLQVAYDEIQDLLSGEYGVVIEFTPHGGEDDDDNDGGVVH